MRSESFEHLALCPFLAICSLSLLLRVMLLHEMFFHSNSEKSIGHRGLSPKLWDLSPVPVKETGSQVCAVRLLRAPS